jgi:hypothetical protein
MFFNVFYYFMILYGNQINYNNRRINFMRFFQILLSSVSLSLCLSTFLLATTYEDAEDGSTDGWRVYDNTPAGAIIDNIYDGNSKSRVITLDGDGRSNSYELGAKKGANAWNNSREKIVHWQMKCDEKYKLYIYLSTEKGSRYLYYSHSNKDKGLIRNKYIHHGLGKQSKNGTWQTFSRNLEADLKKYESDNSILSVNGMRVQGSMKLDNIKLKVAHDDPGDPTVINVPNDFATLTSAISNAKDGDTIILSPGTYHLSSKIRVAQNNLTIASRYHTTGDENYIDTTVIMGNNDKNQEMFDSTMKKRESENLKFIGLTVKNSGKFVIFNYGSENLVDHCKISNIKRDGVSFDEEAGGKVLHTIIRDSGDDAIDVDSRIKGGFEFAHNQLFNSHDDGIEIHSWKDKRSKIKKTMKFDIHDNLIQDSRKDGIQLIDFADNTNRTFNIYNNRFINNGDVGVGAIFELTNHKKAGYKGTAMAELVELSNNTFDGNSYHIMGGDNMRVEGNHFKNASKIAVKRVKGNSIIVNNTFSNNQKDFEDSNNQ